MEVDPPPIDVKDVVTWSKKLKMFLMKKRRNHLGLEPHGLVKAGNNAPANVKETYQKALEIWIPVLVSFMNRCLGTVNLSRSQISIYLKRKCSQQMILQKKLWQVI